MNPVKALTSGKIKKSDIGKTVYLSNSCTYVTCQEWRIADVDHDGTRGTVDLFPKYCLLKGTDGTLVQFYYDYKWYKDSYLRTWLNGNFLNGFSSEIINAMKIQSFPSNINDEYGNGGILYDKVKCPSIDEIGCHDVNYLVNNYGSDCAITEGTIYPLFGDKQVVPNNLAEYKTTTGYDHYYWTRSIDTRNRGNLIFTYFMGNLRLVLSSNSINAIACIRF